MNTPDWVDEKARGIVGPFQAVTGLNNFDCDVLMKEIVAALRQARGDIAGEVCPHWTPAKARRYCGGFRQLALLKRNMANEPLASAIGKEHWTAESEEFDAAADELDMLIQQAEAKEGR